MFGRNSFLLFVLYIENSLGFFEDMYDTGTEICKIYNKLDDVRLNPRYDIKFLDELFIGNNVINKQVEDTLDRIYEKLNKIGKSEDFSELSDSFKNLPAGISLAVPLDSIQIIAESIDEYYEDFHRSRNDSEYRFNQTLREIMEKIRLDIPGNIISIRKNVIEKNKYLPSYRNLLDAIASGSLDRNTRLCGGPGITATVLFRLFEVVMIAELKGNIMLAFANMYRYSRDPEWRLLNSMAREKFETQFAEYVNNFSQIMELVDLLSLRACDPADGNWIRNEDFFELEGTFQKSIFRYHWTACKFSSCDNIWFSERERCEAGIYGRRSACLHTMSDCLYLGGVEACVLKEGPYKFQYVKSAKLGSSGRDFDCPKGNASLIKDGSGINFVYAACACDCYGSHNKISLMLMESEIKNNRVITGLRLIRKDNILFIQPRQGKLGANGQIMKFSQSWMPLPRSIGDSKIRTIDKDKKVFFLDNLRLPPFFALTGVKFNEETRGNITGFALEIFGVRFDYRNGKLSSDDGSRICRKASGDDAGEEVLFEGVNSIYTKLRHTPDSSSGSYIILNQSTLTDDFGQSTLPLFDAVPITPIPTSVLGGIGILHKGAKGYAGFISLRVFPIQYKQYFTDFQRDDMENDRVSFNYSNAD